MPKLTEQPADDAFVRTAIRGMRPPEHHPEFWDVLAGQLDDVEDRMGLGGAFGPPGSLDELPPSPRDRSRVRRPAAHRAGPAPRRAPLRAAAIPVDPAALPVPESAIAAVAPLEPEMDEPPVQARVQAPTAPKAPTAPQPTKPGPRPAPGAHPRQRAFVPAGAAATTVAALAGKGLRPVDPMAGLTIRHDVATLPGAMRRTSNTVLLVLAVLAVAVAAIAGVALVRRASDDGVSPPVPPPAEVVQDASG